ncbi:Putative nuclease HARBI1 [Eumeta japonica]|uniref:Nuclease HARBI1 n=1 Tax=Eumeta variegata TaxID=151549 RepID=A0A4C1YZC3_EUMVA|nr:Putative nuclease HARBI1 [Eumeta japonica]
MLPHQFDFYSLKLKAIQKQDTHMRNAIPAKVKLEVTLRYLATGDSLHTLEALYRVGRSTISIFLPEVCEAIYSALKDYIRIPSREDWIRIEHGFRTKWNFPGCVGALDGKHINIFAPDDTSDYYNYKGVNSIILLALVDDDYCFSYINVGTNGRASDGGVYQKSNLAQAMENNNLNLPDQSVIVADAAFPLKTYLLKPYQTTPTRREKIFNYRLSRARRIVENAFDMYITQRCVDFEDIQQGVVVPGAWRAQMRQVLEGLPPTRYNNHASRRAEAIRNTYAQLFETTEAVPWQGHMI